MQMAQIVCSRESEKYGSSGEPGIQLPGDRGRQRRRRADDRRLDDASLADLVHVQADEQRDRHRAGDGERAPGTAGHGLRGAGGQRQHRDRALEADEPGCALAPVSAGARLADDVNGFARGARSGRWDR